MLTLTDEYWNELDDHTGQISEWLGIVKKDFNSDVKDELFYDALSEHYEISPAAFAAVPHLFEIAEINKDLNARTETISLCGFIHAFGKFENLPDGRRTISDLKKIPLGQSILERIQKEYFESVERLQKFSLNQLGKEENSPQNKIELFIALLAFCEQRKLSRIFYYFSAFDDYILSCPRCENETYLWAEDERIVAYKEDAVFNKKAEKFEVKPVEISRKNWNGEFSDEQPAEWILFLVEKHNIDPLKYQIPYLFSQIDCPHCGQSIKILENIFDYNC